MTRSQAKKIAYSRAWLILQEVIDQGWSPCDTKFRVINLPPSSLHQRYSVFDAKKIKCAMEEIISKLCVKSRGNIEIFPVDDRE